MCRIYKRLVISACLSLVMIGVAKVSADTTTSVINGEITSGDLRMSAPSDLSFSAKLTGKRQVKALDEIKTLVTDYRGIATGWQLTVRSPNFETYGENYQLVINNQPISKNSIAVYSRDKQVMIKEVSLATDVLISATALAGTYGANLEWNLQPNITNSIGE